VRAFASSTNSAFLVSYVLFLIALSRQTEGPERRDAPTSTILPGVTRICVIIVGLIVAFLLIRVLLTPYIYSQIREMALQVGRNPPPFFYLVRDTVRDFLLGACYFAAPFLVYRGIRSGHNAEVMSVD
jgi:hypothetical protein